jgi:hypothetical protein
VCAYTHRRVRPALGSRFFVFFFFCREGGNGARDADTHTHRGTEINTDTNVHARIPRGHTSYYPHVHTTCAVSLFHYCVRVCVCVVSVWCISDRERARDRQRVSVCVCERESESERESCTRAVSVSRASERKERESERAPEREKREREKRERAGKRPAHEQSVSPAARAPSLLHLSAASGVRACMRPSATSVCGLQLLVYEALSY